MAEGNSGQSKGLGELFVEFGQKGGSGLMKALNGISAQFLLTKNTAQQAINMVKDFSKNALNTTVSMDKFSSVTGISAEKLQKWNVWLKLNNYSTEQFLGNIKSLQENMLDIQMGRGNLKGWTLLGLDPHNFDFKKPDEALAAILKRLQQVNEATGALALREMGLSQDLLYLAKQANNQFDERLLLTDKELDNLRKQQAGWNALGATWQAAQEKFIANQSWIVGLLQDTSTWITDLVLKLDDLKATIEDEDTFLGKLWKLWNYKQNQDFLAQMIKKGAIQKPEDVQRLLNSPEKLEKYKRLVKEQKSREIRAKYDYKHPEQTQIQSPFDTGNENTSSQEISNRGTVGNQQPQPLLVPVPELDNQPSIPKKLPPVPSNLTSYNTNNVININQTINSTADATLVANEATSSLIRSLSQAELNNPQVV